MKVPYWNPPCRGLARINRRTSTPRYLQAIVQANVERFNEFTLLFLAGSNGNVDALCS